MGRRVEKQGAEDARAPEGGREAGGGGGRVKQADRLEDRPRACVDLNAQMCVQCTAQQGAAPGKPACAHIRHAACSPKRIIVPFGRKCAARTGTSCS